MLSEDRSSIILKAAAVFVGLSAPLIVTARSTIDILMGIAFVLVLIGANHKQNWQICRPFINHWMAKMVGLTFVALSISIPFSLRIDLSFEAWIRTYALLGAVFYTVFSIRQHLDLCLKVLTLSAGIILLLGLLSLFHISKPDMNTYMLILPVLLYQCFQTKQKSWIIFSLISLIAYIFLTAQVSAKASLAGLILMGAGSFTLYGFKRFGVFKSIVVLAFLTIAIIITLMNWLPDNLNQTSENYADFAYLPIWLVDFHRQLIWLFSIDLAEKSLWVGHGLNASNYHPLANATIESYFGPHFNDYQVLAKAPVLPAHPHNWIIEFLLDSGIVGLIPMLLCVGCLFYISIRNYYLSLHPALLLLLAINLGFWTTSLLNFSFWSVWWLTAYFLSCALAFTLFAIRDDNHHA